MKNWSIFGLLSLIWGSSFLLIKIAGQELSPCDVATGRLVIAALAFACILLITRRSLPRSPKILALLVLIGVTNNAIPFVLTTAGEQSIDSGLASVLNATVPLFTVFIAHFMLTSDRLNAGKLLGLVIGFVGILLLASQSMDLVHPNPIPGQLEILLAALAYAISAVIIHRYLSQLQPLVVSGGSMIGGAMVMLIATLLFERPLPNLGALHAGPILALVTLALAATLLAYTLYFALIRSWGASRATLVGYVVPPVALLLGAFTNAEPLTISLIISTLLIIGGVVLTDLGTSASPVSALFLHRLGPRQSTGTWIDEEHQV